MQAVQRFPKVCNGFPVLFFLFFCIRGSNFKAFFDDRGFVPATQGGFVRKGMGVPAYSVQHEERGAEWVFIKYLQGKTKKT